MKSTTLLLLLVVGFFTNCKKMDNKDNYFKGIVPVNIASSTFSQTSTSQSPIKIQVFASAGNGCYSNFFFKFGKINDFNYTPKGLCDL